MSKPLKTLKTPQSFWSAIFRRIVLQLENDPNVKRVVGAQNIRSWQGIPADKAPMVPTSSAPVIRLTPNPRNVDWYSPDAQAGTLSVGVEIAVQSLCCDDPLDLWQMLCAALFANGPALAGGVQFSLDLVALGAETGEIVFSDPAVIAGIDGDGEGFFTATGQFHLRAIGTVGP